MLAAIDHTDAAAHPFCRCVLELGDNARYSPAAAVALEDELAAKVGRGASPPILRIWENGRAIVVPRWRLSGRSTLSVIDRFGCEWPIVPRGSGGAAVVHGPGTLNLSLILPLHGPSHPSIEESYRLWISVLDSALRDGCGIGVDAGRVDGAFCSGRYDAAVAGRKLAGLAQARRNGSVLIHGTILTQVDRAAYLLLIDVAEQLIGISEGRAVYDPEQLVSLHELTERAVSADELAGAITRAAAEHSLLEASAGNVSDFDSEKRPRWL